MLTLYEDEKMRQCRISSEVIRVAIVSESTDVGGIPRYCIELAAQLALTQGIEVMLIAPIERSSSSWLLDQALIQNVKIHLIPMSSSFDISAIWRLGHMLRLKKIDVLHVQSYRFSIIGALATALFGLRTKRVSTVHSLYQLKLNGKPRLFVSTDLRVKKLLRDKVIAVSRDICDQLVNCGFERSAITVVPNGVSIPLQARSSERPIPRGSRHGRTFGFVGRLVREKGISRLVEIGRRVLAEVPNAELVIVGDGALSELVAGLRVAFGERVRWDVDELDPERIYPMLDVLISPSETEGLPFVILEAMGRGIPVVATAVGGVPEVITHGEDGFLFAPEDIDGLTTQILRLFADPDLRHRISQRASAKVQMMFSRELMATRTCDVYIAAVDRAWEKAC